MRTYSSSLLIFLCLSMTGCSIAGIRRYDPYFKNTQVLTKTQGSFKGVVVDPGNEKMHKLLVQSSMNCRLTDFNMPANMNVHDYIAEAMRNELDAAQKLDPKGKDLQILVQSLESNTSSTNKGQWNLDFTYQLSGTQFKIKTTTEFESAFAAQTACQNTAQALQDALRENFGRFFNELASRKVGAQTHQP